MMKTYRLNSNILGLHYGDTFQSDDDKGWAPLVKNRLISEVVDVVERERQPRSDRGSSRSATGKKDAADSKSGSGRGKKKLPGGGG